jgi:hypothetical protein
MIDRKELQTNDPAKWIAGADRLDAKAAAMEAEALILHQKADAWRKIAARLIEVKRRESDEP